MDPDWSGGGGLFLMLCHHLANCWEGPAATVPKRRLLGALEVQPIQVQAAGLVPRLALACDGGSHGKPSPKTGTEDRDGRPSLAPPH